MARGYSFHIGLNHVSPDHYDGWSGPLSACEADAAAMRQICSSRGFEPRSLLTRDATRAAVLAQLAELAHVMVAGDTLILSYAGHGAQLPDGNGDEDDGLDESWCLFDGQLLDDELSRVWASFAPGTRIAVFSDSCNSGTVLRSVAQERDGGVDDPSFPYRAMPNEIQYRTYEANRAFYDDLARKPAPPADPACTVVLVSACQDNQLAADGAYNGKFTGALITVWANGRFAGNYSMFAKAIRKKLPRRQSPNYLAIGAADTAFLDGQVFTF